MLNIKLIRCNNGILDLSSDLIREIEDIVSWRREPSFYSDGRVAWHVLQEPVVSKDGKHIFKAIKFKGIGVRNTGGRNETRVTRKPEPPTDEIFERKSAHFGIDNEGKIVNKFSESTPYGGMLLRRALQEYDAAEILFKNEVPSIVPGCVFKYTEKSFRGESMGVSVMFSEESEPYRLMKLIWEDEFVEPHLRRFFEKIINEVDGEERWQVKLKSAKRIAFQYGDIIRRFSESGLYIHSGGWDNLQYNSEKEQIFLTDLDSTRKLEELPSEVWLAQAVRDLSSIIYRYLNKVYHPMAIKLYDEEKLLNIDVIEGYLKGYFRNSHEEALKELSSEIWSVFFERFKILKKYECNLIDMPKINRKRLKMNKYYFYGECMKILYPFAFDNMESIKSSKSLKPEELRDNVQVYMEKEGII